MFSVPVTSNAAVHVCCGYCFFISSSKCVRRPVMPTKCPALRYRIASALPIPDVAPMMITFFISQLFSFQQYTVVDSKSCNDQQKTNDVNITYFFTKDKNSFYTA